jgi:hypothetical protein
VGSRKQISDHFAAIDTGSIVIWEFGHTRR